MVPLLSFILNFISLIMIPGHASPDSSPDWSSDADMVPGEDRANIYELQEAEFKRVLKEGYQHINKWPVEVTGLLIPYEPLKFFLESDDKNTLQNFVYKLSSTRLPFRSVEGLYEWLGLAPYPTRYNGERRPYIDGVLPEFPMGAGLIKNQDGVLGLTFSCATCHTQSFFGHTLVGLTNKRPRANEFFHLAKQYVPLVPTAIFKEGTNATAGEALMFKKTKGNLPPVGAKAPVALGLDTSLAQVAMSLARRNRDDYATRNRVLEKFPRFNALSGFHIADSKPATWWGLKYKTRWLSDGSIISGNPVHTNFLWNELGRGTDLYQLEQWLQNNIQTVEAITALAFSTTPPQYLEIFPTHTINLAQAKRGEILFNNTCSKCHGIYEKAWHSNDADTLSELELLKTTKVIYHQKTPVIDVGTDPGRHQGMKYFADDLNRLQISKSLATVVEPTKGYVPPPLIGIFARYPYMHNNSIPNLCELLKPGKLRVKTFYQGPSDNPDTDFDRECVGYPTGAKIPVSFKKNNHEAFFDTRRKGMSNMGHDKMFYDDNGRFKFSEQDRRDLIAFLKTL